MATDIIARGLALKRPPPYIFVDNYSALPTDPILNQMYYCLNSEGTSWLPGSWGGTYHPAGPYIYNGLSWDYVDNPIAATQQEVDAGVENYKFVSPYTLQNSSQMSALQTGKIPYTGANTNVDLGENDLTIDTNTFFVDSDIHMVGVKNLNPQTALHVKGQVTIELETAIPPFIVNSTAKVENLNVSYLEGYGASAFAGTSHEHPQYITEEMAIAYSISL